MKREFISVVLAIFFFLPILATQSLTKISEAIEQAECDQRHIQIARRFKMIAGENSEPARIKRQRIVHSELGTEISDWVLGCGTRTERQLRPGLGVAHVFSEATIELLHATGERRIGRDFGES